MSQDPLSGLTKEQIAFLVQLVQEEDGKKETIAKAKKQEQKFHAIEKKFPPYLLETIYVCHTCRRSTIKFFRMVYSPTKKCYLSTQIPYMIKGIEVRRNMTATMVCPNCPYELGKMEKEKLVKMIIRSRLEIYTEYSNFTKEVDKENREE
jgi:hypothetical protein